MARPIGQIDYLDRRNIIEMLNDEFSHYDPAYRDTKAAVKDEIDELSDRIIGIQKKGNPLVRSEQILDEVVWLHHYTADWNRLYRRIHDLRRSLELSQLYTIDQRKLVSGRDGGFGAGTTEFFSKLDATTDAVQAAGMAPLTPLRFLAPILSAGRLSAYLHRLLMSDIRRTGTNNRGELASIESSLLQFFEKNEMRALLCHPAVWKHVDWRQIEFELCKIIETFADFIDQSQHPRTGYWGPWYLIDGEMIKLHDLSYTFHVANFRHGRIDRWPAVIRTTIAIKNLVYPYGWKPSEAGAKFSNHHNMDIVTLFRMGFKAVDVPTRRLIAQSIFEMLDWCLTESLNPARNDFMRVGDIDTVDRYNFGIMFLKLTGYWNDEPFWWDPQRDRPERWPRPADAAKTLLPAIDALKSESSFVDDMRKLLMPLVVSLDGRRPSDPQTSFISRTAS